MLRWIENYYVGSSVRKPEEMKEKINSGFFAPGIYLLTLSDNPNNLLEFLPAASLKQKAVYRLCPTIIDRLGEGRGHRAYLPDLKGGL